MKTLRNVLIVIALSGLFLYLGAGPFLSFFSAPLFSVIGPDLEKEGIEFSGLQTGSLGICSWKAVCAENILWNCRIRRKDSLVADRGIQMTADRARFEMLSFKNKIFRVRLEKVRAFILPPPGFKGPEDLIEVSETEILFPLVLNHPGLAKKQLRDLARELGLLLTEGRGRLDMKLSATSYFTVEKVPLQADLLMDRDGSGVRFVMNPEDLRKISRSLKERLSEAEVELLSQNPMRAAGLLRIRNEAINTAITEVPEPDDLKDEYRHVLWAYLLTRAYGENFAREVMNAHETGSAVPNTPEEQRMDKLNNEVGVGYAKAGYSRSSLLERTRKDPAAVRHG